MWMSFAYVHTPCALPGTRRVSAAVDLPRRRYALFRPSSSENKRCKSKRVRRNVYGGDGTYVNTELTVPFLKCSPPLKIFSAMENDAPVDPAVTKDAHT